VRVSKDDDKSPVSDVLESQSFASLAQVVRERTAAILYRWETVVREALPRADAMTLAQLRDEVPKTLSMLADALESSKPRETRDLAGHSGAHGIDRFAQGFDLAELLVEYRLLRRVVIDEVEAHMGRRTSRTEDLALGMAIDTVLAEGVNAFFQHLRAEISAATDAEQRFLAYLSHDLRNQLNYVSLLLELIVTKLHDVPEATKDVSDIAAARKAIGETVEGMERLLKSTRLRSGRAEVQMQAVNLQELLQAQTAAFKREAGLKGIKIVTRVVDRATAVSDRRLVMVILHNLLSNAVKFSDDGTITVAVDPLENSWQLTVADEGKGVSEEFKQRMFEEFSRDQAHADRPGMGLGLAIVARAAKLLGAEMVVDSKPGAGTTFRITCPGKLIGVS
jgi:signal transduction histidine kinase